MKHSFSWKEIREALHWAYDKHGHSDSWNVNVIYEGRLREELRIKLIRNKKPRSNLIPLPEKKKGGRKSVSPLSGSGDVTSVVKRVESAV